MYKLNKNSKASRFYSWIYNTDVTKYKTMCPYFWRYGFTILLLPLILIIKLILYPLPSLSRIKDKKNSFLNSNLGCKIDIILVTLAVLFISIAIYLMYINISSINELLKIIILLTVTSIILIGVAVLLTYILSFIESIYKKLCPVIYWGKE